MIIPIQFVHRLLPVVFLLTLVTPAFAQWNSIQLPCRPEIINLQVLQGKVFASTGGDNVFESADKGSTWKRTFQGIKGFTLNPADNSIFYFTNNNTEIRFTPNQGTTTYFYTNPLPATNQPPGLTFSNDTVYLYYGKDLLRSKGLPGNLTWTPVSLPPDFYIHNCQVSGKHIWADNFAFAIHSANGGISWDTVAQDPQNGMHLARSGDTILLNYFDLAQGVRVLSRTINQGQNWTTDAMHPYIGLVKGGKPFLGYDVNFEKAYFSWNGLTDWQPLNFGALPNVLAAVGGVNIAGLPSGVWTETNGQWRGVSFGTGISDKSAYGILRKTDGYLLFGSENGGYGMAKHADGSSSWLLSEKPYFAERLVQLGNHLIGSGNYGTYRAQPGGSGFEWELINAQGGYLYSMAGKLYLLNPKNRNIFRSTDEGQTWVQTGTAPEPDPSPNEFDPIFAGTDGRFFMRKGADLMVSENEGATWNTRYTFSLDFNGDVSRLFAVNGRLFLSHVTTKQVFTSTDYGFTFNTVPAPKNTPAFSFRLRVHENILFLYNGDLKLYRSADWGQTWEPTKLPYLGFDFSPTMDNMTVRDSTLYLFDPSRGAAWMAKLNELKTSPCDSVMIDMPPLQCYGPLVNNVIAPPGMQYTWYENGMLIQQSNFYNPLFSGKNDSTYKLVITHPTGGCTVSAETKIRNPVADVAFTGILPCNQEFDTLDLSGCSHYPGISYNIYRTVPNWSLVYTNHFDAAGNPSNPNPPAVPPLQNDYFNGYLLVVEDTQYGCQAWDTAFVERDPNITISKIDILPASCGQANGTASVQNTANPGQSTFGWSNGNTTQTASGLAPGWYSVTVTNGFCQEQQNFKIEEDPACKVRIRGKIWNDPVVPDCSPDGNTAPAKEVLLRLLPDSIYTFTNAQGNYEFVRPPGNYTVEFVDPVRFDLLCPAAGKIALSLPDFGSISPGNDFYVKAKPVKNLAVTVTAGPAVPGFPQKFHMQVCNHGDQTVPAATLMFNYAPELSGISPVNAFTSDDAATHTARRDNIFIYPQNCLDFDFQMQVPAAVPLGTPLHFSADILPNSDDFTPADNHQYWAQTVVGSFDPNDKRVSPGDTEFGGKIFEKDTVLRYTIRFQNTGKYPATTVEIRDTLDNNLDVTSILSGRSSHPYPFQLRFEGRNVLVFRFENIYLPDSMTNQELSQGFVTFSIKRKPGLAYGTRIRNRGGIYFDFNTPVITNTVESVLSPPVGTSSAAPEMEITLYPNPNTGVFSIELTEPATMGTNFRVTDLAGRVLLEKQADVGSQLQTVEAAALQSGLYFLQVVSSGRVVATEKFVKQ